MLSGDLKLDLPAPSLITTQALSEHMHTDREENSQVAYENVDFTVLFGFILCRVSRRMLSITKTVNSLLLHRHHHLHEQSTQYSKDLFSHPLSNLLKPCLLVSGTRENKMQGLTRS